MQAFTSELSTVAFIDLAGFSAIADVYGDVAAMSVLENF
jgi:adenylate cyclase